MARRNDCYTEEEKAEIMAYVLVQVACGRFVSRVFRQDQTTDSGIKLPCVRMFWMWVYQDDSGELMHKLTHAREQGVEALLDETTEIADETAFDTIVQHTDSGTIEKPNKEWMARSRLRVDTRLKLAAMLKPRKYGAKLDVTSNGKTMDVNALAAAAERARKYASSEEAKHDEGNEY